MTTRRSFLGLLGTAPVAAIAVSMGPRPSTPEAPLETAPAAATVGWRMRIGDGPWVEYAFPIYGASGETVYVDYWTVTVGA